MWPLLHRAFEERDFDLGPEVLLPVFVGRILHHGPLHFEVLVTTSRCVRVTHPDDLALVQVDVRSQVDAGERPDVAFG